MVSEPDRSDWERSATATAEWSNRDAIRDVVLESISELYFVMDRSGAIQEYNEQFTAVLGYTDEEIADLDPLSIIAPADRAAMEATLDTALAGDKQILEAQLVTSDGRQLPHEFTVVPVTDDDGTVRQLVTIGRAVSSQGDAIKPESEYETAPLVSNLPGVVYRCRNEPGLPMSFVSSGCQELTGYPGSAVESGELSWTDDIVHPEDREQLWETVLSALDDDEPFRTTYRIVRKDGTVRWVWEQGRHVSRDGTDTTVLEGYITDITERKHRKTILERYEQLIDTVGDGVYVLDRNQRVSQVNDALLEMVGYDREEMIGMHVTGLVTNHDVEEEARLRDQLQGSDQRVATLRAELSHKTGGKIPVEIRFSLLSSTNGYATIGLVRDISDRRARGELFKQLHEGARRLMDAETVDEVATTAATISQTYFDGVTAGVRLHRNDQLEVVAVEPDDSRLRDWSACEVGVGLVGQAYAEGDPGIYDDLTPRMTAGWDTQIRSVLLLPVEGYGILELVSTDPSAFDETDLELGRLFTADLEAAFRRADREQQVRQRKCTLEKYETLVETMSDGVYMTNADHEITMVNSALCGLTGYDRDQLLGMSIAEMAGESMARRSTRERERLRNGELTVGQVAGPLETQDGTEVAVEDRFALLPGGEGGTVGVIRDVTRQKQREAQLRTQRDELETLNRLNELVQEILTALAAAATREEIQTTVCDRLAESTLFQLAAIATQPPDDSYLDVEVWAGDEAAYLSEVDIQTDTDSEDAGPAAKALETGTVTVTHDIQADPLFEPYREAALEHGFRSLAVVPLTYNNVVHGLLIVYADRTGAFSQRERQAFEVLGEMVGFAISATQNRRLIESDTHLELTFSVTDVDSLLTEISTRTGCPCRLLGSAELSGEERLHYVSVSGATAADVMAVIEDVDREDTCRLIRDDGDGVVLELSVADSLAAVLVGAGFRPLELTTDDDAVRIVAHAPLEADIRSVTDRLASHGDVSLVSKAKVDSWRDPDQSIRDELATALTDRQQAVLDAAYFGGYFHWPRDSTAEEIADSLDISSPTFHQHLRHAQRKLLQAYLADSQQE